ncbi:MAG: aspartate aminotransferase family protein [Pseudomonadota bacterium]
MKKESINVAGDGLPKISHGQGSYVWDTSGKQYIDGSGGPAVYSLGYGHAEVREAIVNQLDRIMHGYRFTFTSDPLEQLTEILGNACGGDLNAMVFVCSGSEAVESALKIALQYHSARGDMTRRRFIARRRSWHGNTLGALSVSDFLERRAPFEGALLDASFLSQVNAYRPMDGASPETVAQCGAAELEAEIERVGPENIAAFIFEPVVGAAGGVVPSPTGYAKAVREICDRHGILMIADEVMCGSGRCGSFRALEFDDVVPDIMTVAKGLAAGYIPIGAAIYRREIHSLLVDAHGGPLTGHTFTGHTTACAAAVAVQTVIRRDDLLNRVTANGPLLLNALADALVGVPEIGDLRGRGHFIGIELVADPASKRPFDSNHALYLQVRREAMSRGLICYPSGGNVDGRLGDCVILAPPYNASDDELGEIVDKTSASIRAALHNLPRHAWS